MVTAQKRVENLQDVPIAVTTFDGKQLEKTGAGDMRDIAIRTPGFTMTQFNVGEPQYSIRGVVNAPINDRLAARLSLGYRNRDGYSHHILTGADLDGGSNAAARLQLLIAASDSTTILAFLGNGFSIFGPLVPWARRWRGPLAIVPEVTVESALG